MRKILAIITARSGSKSIPKKNITLLAGKPLIAWTIEAAIECKSLSRVIVSTDDEEIAAISKEYGAEVPFLRPAVLAQDTSSHIPVLIHALKWIEENEHKRPDYVLLLQPTSLLRTANDIQKSIDLVVSKNADSVVSVAKAESHPYLVKRINPEGIIKDFGPIPDGYLRRQELPEVFVPNGAIYLVRRSVLLDEETLYPPRTFAYVMDQKRSIDIDTVWDLHLAELILRDHSLNANN